MNSITTELIDYLKRLPARSAAARRQFLEETRSGVALGERGAESLLPFALADHDEDVVFAATSAYVGVVRDALAALSPAAAAASAKSRASASGVPVLRSQPDTGLASEAMSEVRGASKATWVVV